jgi:hypothetical protein
VVIKNFWWRSGRAAVGGQLAMIQPEIDEQRDSSRHSASQAMQRMLGHKQSAGMANLEADDLPTAVVERPPAPTSHLCGLL